MEIFNETFMPDGLNDVVARQCPRCSSARLRHVASLDQTHLLCASCGHCWYPEHGHLHAVDVLACHGCSARTKRGCIALLHDEFPRFGLEAAEAVE
jgi:hypothetical protein